MRGNFEKTLEEFKLARSQGFVIAKELKEKGGKLVGTFCTYTPKELIYAAGAYPVTLCGVSEATIPASEAHLPKNLCPLIKSSYGYAITDKCPYFYFSDFIVGETTCDGKKKMFEYLNEIKDTYVMHLPNVQNGEYTEKLWEDEICNLKEKLEKEYSVKISDEDIKKSIKLCNEERRWLKEFYSLGKLVPPPLSGYEMYNILNGVLYIFDKEEQIKKIKEIISQLKECHKNGNSPISKDAPRILITGCPMGGVAEKVIKQLEEVGSVVVAYENCGGAKNIEGLVDEEKEPIKALAEKYLSIPCSIMSPNKGREKLLEEMVEEYKIDGVIEIVLQSCHTYALETRNIKKKISSKGIPYMSLETDYSPSDLGQIRTRLEAFVEML